MNRSFLTALVVGVVVGCSGCSTPRTAGGTLEQGKERVTQLVLDAARALPATAQYDPPTLVGTQPCRRTIAGYAVGETGAHRAEVPLIVHTTTPTSPSISAALGSLEAAWAKAGYQLDRSRIHETRFPQLRAHAPGGYDVVATAFAMPFVVKVGAESYTDYMRRARAAHITPVRADTWNGIGAGTLMKHTLVATQIDLYSVSQCLRGT